MTHLEGEIWKDIEGFEDSYQISNYGRVKSKERVIPRIVRERILKPSLCNGGYLTVPIGEAKRKKTISIHREMAKAFIPIPDELKNIPIEKLVINHKDENKTNNCLANLEWCTTKYNNAYGTARERMIQTQRENSPKKKPILQLSKNNEIIKKYSSIQEAARETNSHSSNIADVLKGRRKTAKGFIWQYC